MFHTALIVATTLVSFSVIDAEEKNIENTNKWSSDDGRLSISGLFLAQPEADPSKRKTLIAVGNPATFKHSGAAYKVTGEAQLILYYSSLQRLELHGLALLKGRKDSYSAEKIIYDIQAQKIVHPGRHKYFIKPRNRVDPNQGFNSDAAKGAALG